MAELDGAEHERAEHERAEHEKAERDLPPSPQMYQPPWPLRPWETPAEGLSWTWGLDFQALIAALNEPAPWERPPRRRQPAETAGRPASVASVQPTVPAEPAASAVPAEPAASAEPAAVEAAEPTSSAAGPAAVEAVEPTSAAEPTSAVEPTSSTIEPTSETEPEEMLGEEVPLATVAGRIAEALPAGPDLAGWLANSPASELDDGALAGIAASYRRLASWAQAGELAVVAQLASRSAAADERIGVDEQGRPARLPEEASAQVSLALTMSQASASWWSDLAVTLTWRLPSTGAALRSGQIDLTRARLIAEATGALDEETARLVESKVLPVAGEKTTAQLRAALRRAVIAADPGGSERRREEAERRARVCLFPDQDGTASLSGYSLPSVRAAAAMARISALARALHATGAGGGIDLLRAQVFMGLLLGTLPYIPPAADGPVEPPPDDVGDPPAGEPPAGEPPVDDSPAGPVDDSPAGVPGPRPRSEPGEGRARGRSGAGPGHGSETRRPSESSGSQSSGSQSSRSQSSVGQQGPPADKPASAAGKPAPAADEQSPTHSPSPPTRPPPPPAYSPSPPTRPPPPPAYSPSPPTRPPPTRPPPTRQPPPVEHPPPPVEHPPRANGWPVSRPPPAWPAVVPFLPSGPAAMGNLQPAGGGLLDLQLPWSTLTGESGEPGHLGRIGPITPAQARSLANVASADPDVLWRVIITNRDGQALAVTRVPRAAGKRTADEVSDVGQAGGPGPGLGRGLVRRVTLTISADCLGAAEPLGLPSSLATRALRAATLAAERAGWQAQADAAAAGGCAHEQASPAYRPPPRLREFVTARDVTCRFLTCRQPVWRCDLDHSVPFDQGGRTCSCNLGGLCRFHHQVKQHRGWELTQLVPGTFAWTTPVGRVYVVEPDRHAA